MQEQCLESTAIRVPRNAPWIVIAVLFCLSGVPALVYQLAWQRILALHSGVGIYSVSMIVSSFLAGLGIGSYIGGLVSTRLSPKSALYAFAAVELGIGLFGSASCVMYYDWGYGRFSWLLHAPWCAAACHFAAVLLPTTLMGMSLPVLSRGMVHDWRAAGRTVGSLYGMNVLGAAIGAALTPWFLFRLWGVRGAVLAGVFCNAAVGVGALAVAALFFTSRRPEEDSTQSTADVAHGSRSGPEIRPFWLWVALYAVSGFTGLGLEVVWFRVCDVAVKSTAFTFGTVLAIYLFGMAAGSGLGLVVLKRIRRPLRGFLICQCWLVACAGVGLVLLTLTPCWAPMYRWFVDYWRGYNGIIPGQGDPLDLAKLYVLLPTALIAIPTGLMGVAFTLLQHAVHDDEKTCGLKVGILQAANIGGCVVGSLLVGLVLLSTVGTAGAMRVLLGAAVFLAALGMRYYGLRSPFLPLGVGLSALLACFPDNQSFWLRLHGIDTAWSAAARWSFVDEDATGVVAITPEDQGTLRISVDGKGHSWLPFGSIHSLLGAVPAVVHPAPREIAIIGLGSGDTAWAAGCRSQTERLVIFELCAPEERMLRRVARSTVQPNLNRFLNDRRARIVVADGRNELARKDTAYDVIEADASRAETAYAGNLYSIEFFELCARRLKPNGLMCTWSPTPRTYATFCDVFPYVLNMNDGEILLGSNEALSVELADWEARTRSTDVSSYLGFNTTQALLQYLGSGRPADRKSVGRMKPNRDLFPRDEFKSPYVTEARRPAVLEQSR